MNGEADLLQVVQREPVVKHVHRELRRAILQGRFPPQSRLVETSLAQLLQVSRTPVREAISKLESEGLVRRLRGGGVVVEDTTAKLSEVVILRQSMEGAAVRLACLRASDEELEDLAAFCATAQDSLPSASLKVRSELDREFHMRLARASHNVRVVNLVEEFYEYSYSELAPGNSAEDLRLLQRQHIAIAEALKARDGGRAEAALREHLDTVARIIRGRVSA